MSYDVSLVDKTAGYDRIEFDRNHTSNTAGMWRAAGCDIADFHGRAAGAMIQPLAGAIEAIAHDAGEVSRDGTRERMGNCRVNHRVSRRDPLGLCRVPERDRGCVPLMTANPNRYVTVTLSTHDHAELMRIANETGLSPKRLADAMVAGAIREYGPREEGHALGQGR